MVESVLNPPPFAALEKGKMSAKGAFVTILKSYVLNSFSNT